MNALIAPLQRLLGSSKVMVVMICVIFAFIALFLGRISWDDALGFIKWLVSTLVVSIAAEDAAGKIGGRSAAQPADPVPEPQMPRRDDP